MQLSLVTPPSEQPVSLNEAKRQCAVLDDTHDLLLSGYIAAATEYAEGYTGARFMTQTVRLTFESFPKFLPIYPVQNIDSIIYDDENGNEQTMSSDDYYSSLDGSLPRIASVNGWPTISDVKPGPVRITVRVGFTSIPAQLKTAILVMVKEMYANRGETTFGAPLMDTAFAAHRLLHKYKRPRL